MIAGFDLRKLPQKRNHIRCRAHVAEVFQEPRHWKADAFLQQLFFLQLVDLVVGVMNDGDHQFLFRRSDLLHQFLVRAENIGNRLNAVPHEEFYHAHQSSHGNV